MDGVAALKAVLTADAVLVTLVPADNIHAGPLPLNFSLPAISLATISIVDRNIPAPGATRHVRERVQATIYARNYPQQKLITRAARRAAADKINPEVPGISAVTIHTEGAGPDFMAEDASIWMGTQDFITTYTETR
ncbi:hypothetical protein HNO88_001581 [Novosphingobium chloroacetimidivorans]|uniref:Uncharacterized protein n=1 Tax=Novosphingobium chloroacetimidivorans TaxID=1428314 RepID=A0A7W7NWM6_9SPHN|nr:hypothetical protein [Novosphingobium chloroacetimidivorans]MBB4858262.1 hypothetical protein [Novosphingobium chloroacetimidivorans]